VPYIRPRRLTRKDCGSRVSLGARPISLRGLFAASPSNGLVGTSKDSYVRPLDPSGSHAASRVRALAARGKELALYGGNFFPLVCGQCHFAAQCFFPSASTAILRFDDSLCAREDTRDPHC